MNKKRIKTPLTLTTTYMDTNTIRTFLKAYSLYMRAPVQVISSLIQRQKDEHVKTLRPEDINSIRCTVKNMEHELDNLKFYLKRTY